LEKGNLPGKNLLGKRVNFTLQRRFFLINIFLINFQAAFSYYNKLIKISKSTPKIGKFPLKR
jgi:hypothetical protein